MQVKIDRDGCISCGLCASICPKVFQIAEDDLAEVYQQPQKEDYDMVKEAEQGCPVEVIHTEE